MLRRNLVANYLGQGWTAVMGLAFIPVYIKYLGIEAYGLIGLFAVLNAWLGLLDMGMTPALSREMARYSEGAHTAQSIRDLLRSIEIIASGIAVAIAGGIALASSWLASYWLRTEHLPPDLVSQALTIMGIVTALRFVEGIYRGSVVGLQRQVALNIATSLMATARWGGAVIVLWMAPTIEAFFLWQGLISLATVMILAATTYVSLPSASRWGRFSLHELSRVWSFAGGVFGISLLALLLTQVDKVILSRLLSLTEYGHYMLAAAVAGGLLTLYQPIQQAWVPRLIQLHTKGCHQELVSMYHLGSQLVSVLIGSAGLVLVMFSETFILLWTQDEELTRSTANIMRILVLGRLFNSLMAIPYEMQLVHGWTSLIVKMNLVAVVVLLPAIIIFTPLYGAEGAAWVWLCLNLGYVFFGVHFLYRRVLTEEKWNWYKDDVLFPLLSAFIAMLLLKSLLPAATNPLGQVATLIMASFCAILAASMGATQIRERALGVLRRMHLRRIFR